MVQSKETIELQEQAVQLALTLLMDAMKSGPPALIDTLAKALEAVKSI